LENAGEKLARKVVKDPEMVDSIRYVAWTLMHPISDEMVLSEK
jgi:hypothetical protein